jgi:hypothetical protein
LKQCERISLIINDTEAMLKDKEEFCAISCSESGETGQIFCVIFSNEDRDSFCSSRLVVGHGTVVVKPQLEGEWAGCPLLWTPEPLLPRDMNMAQFVPSPLPENVSIINSTSRVGS